ncbi:MAG TPA: hypothetical protein P5509_07025 [Bacteroidales bacterium]|nr:hypothetical protein [Bacteroidales bacterium]
MSLENGWINTYRICDSNSVVCGEMICATCGGKIENELYLMRDRVNFKHRGNETDEVYLYHKNCKTGKKFTKMWETHEKEVNAEKEALTKRNAKLVELRNEISAWGFNEDDLF